MQNAVIYARYSSDNQREESITAQIRAIEEYSKKENYYIIDIYQDEAQSATTDDRKDFLRMIDDSKKGMFDVIIVHKLDRFARNRYDSAIYKRELRLNGVRVVSVTENLDGSPESVILESVLEGMSEYYSANLAREVKKGLKENALQARHTGGRPPLGYDVGEDMRLVLNDFEAEAVKIIYNMYSDGHSYGQIISELSNRGFKTKAGKAFGKNSLYEILRQEKYTGTYVFNRRSRGTNGKYNNHKESSDIIKIENGCPQIIDKRMWFKVQDRMKGNKKIGGQNKAKVEYLLSGKIFCGNCGSAMVGHTTSDSKTKKKYHYYVCANKKRTGECGLKGVGKDKIEELVLNNLYAGVFSDSVIEKSIDKILDYSNKKQVTLPGLLEEYKANLKTIDADINKIIDLLMSGYRNESFKQKLDELEDAKLDLKTIITKTELQINTYAYNRNDVSNFMYNFKNFRDMDFKNQRKVINMFVYKVIIFDDRYDMKLFTNPMMSDIASPRVLDTGGHSSPRPSVSKEYITINLWTKED